MIGFNIYQIVYASVVVGIGVIFFARKYYQAHQKKQKDKWHRKDWKSRY